jgi:hypothetical protein
MASLAHFKRCGQTVNQPLDAIAKSIASDSDPRLHLFKDMQDFSKEKSFSL